MLGCAEKHTSNILFVVIKYIYKKPPYIVKCFFLIFQGIFSYISQMNEPRRWVFLCIWYENSWFGVYEVKRLSFPLYMALCIPLLLWQLTSRVYQDLLTSRCAS